MTIDDDNSVYVGGLPYDATQDSLRRVFDLYGSIVAVKIINDRGVGGKCYGFVTYTNPRSAVDAINDMNGRTIAGRVVRVNEVKTRGGRPNFGGENFRRNLDRGVDRDRGRDRDGDYDRDRDLYQDRIRDVSRDRDRDQIRDVSRDRDRDRIRDVSRDRDLRNVSRIRDVSRDRHRDLIRDVSRDRDQDREREFGHARDHDQIRDRFVDRDRDRDQDRELEDNEQEHERNQDREWERDLELDRGRDRDLKRTNDDHKSGDSDKDQTSKKRNGISNDHHSRDVSSGSSDYDHDGIKAGPADPKVSKRLEMSNQRLKELQNEISHMEELAEEKRQLVSKLQEKSEKLQDALVAAKKLSSHHQIQLTKLHKCYQHIKDYSEKLKGCELELQSLVDATMIEVDVGNDVRF